MYKFILKSGKIVELNIAPLNQGLSLLQTMLKIAADNNINLKDLFNASIADVICNNTSSIFNICASDEVLTEIEKCCDKVSYNKQKYRREIFENEETREDFIPLMVLVGCENLRPFFGKAPLWCTAIEALILTN